MGKKSKDHDKRNKRTGTWVRLHGGPVFACIDMGTNSFHMIVCRATPERDHFEVITREREAVPFFRRSLSAHYIDDVSLRSAIRILRGMIRKATTKGATAVVAVATSAVRESKNGTEALERIRKELKLDARMISGKEEARLIYLGVLWSMPALRKQFAIVDIGGGSTEVIVGDRRQTQFAESYKLGAARLTERFFDNGQPTAQTIKDLHDEVRGVLRPMAEQVKIFGFGQLIGTSGTIQTVAKLDRLRRRRRNAEIHGWKIGISRLNSLVQYIEQSALEGDRIKGISLDRNQTILAGAIVLLETMRSLKAKEITVCTAALREGVTVDHFLQTGWLNGGLVQHRDPRSESVHALLDKYNASTKHAEQVAFIASEIFRQTKGHLHKYPEKFGHLLWSAAMLHDVGMFVGRNGHHKHSYYLIKHGGLLGHSEEEVELIASIARYHRGSMPKESHEAFTMIPQISRKLVSDMAAMLRIAEALDRGHRQVVKDVRIDFPEWIKRSNTEKLMIITLKLKSQDSCQAESWALSEKKELFESQFQVKLGLTVDFTIDNEKNRVEKSRIEKSRIEKSRIEKSRIEKSKTFRRLPAKTKLKRKRAANR